MTKAEKTALVERLSSSLAETPSFYLLDIGGMSVESSNAFRRKMQEGGYRVEMVKNTLLKKALENHALDYSEVYPALSQTSAIVMVDGETASAPAKLLKDFRGDADRPSLKAAFIEESTYLGDEQLVPLTKLKSKTDLLGEIVTLLQSPPKNLLSLLQSGEQKIAGLIKALEERGESA